MTHESVAALGVAGAFVGPIVVASIAQSGAGER
jgi:hypothetical protein